MDSNCATCVANLFLICYERDQCCMCLADSIKAFSFTSTMIVLIFKSGLSNYSTEL